jgi:hypothetical protein
MAYVVLQFMRALQRFFFSESDVFTLSNLIAVPRHALEQWVS